MNFITCYGGEGAACADWAGLKGLRSDIVLCCKVAGHCIHCTPGGPRPAPATTGHSRAEGVISHRLMLPGVEFYNCTSIFTQYKALSAFPLLKAPTKSNKTASYKKSFKHGLRIQLSGYLVSKPPIFQVSHLLQCFYKFESLKVPSPNIVNIN